MVPTLVFVTGSLTNLGALFGYTGDHLAPLPFWIPLDWSEDPGCRGHLFCGYWGSESSLHVFTANVMLSFVF